MLKLRGGGAELLASSNGRGSTGSSRTTTTCERRSNRRRPALERAAARWHSPSGGLAAARVPERGAHPLRSHGGPTVDPGPRLRGPLCRGRRHRLLAGHHGQQTGGTRSSSGSGAISVTSADANALYNDAYADILPMMGITEEHHLGPERTVLARGREKLEEALALYRHRRHRRRRQHPVGARAITTHLPPHPAEHWYRESSHCIARRVTDHGSLVPAHAGAGPHRQRRDRRVRRACPRGASDLRRRRRCRRDALTSTTSRPSQCPRATRPAPAVARRRTTPADHERHTLALVEETYKQFKAPSPRSVLSRDEFDRYTAEGAPMGLDEVVAYALEDPAPVLHGTTMLDDS